MSPPMSATDPHTRLAVSPDGAASTHLQFLRFALDHDLCAMRIDAVREILEVGHLTPLPLMPTFVRGVMNLRGAVVPVIDLRARLGMPVTPIGRRTCVIIVDVPHPEQPSPQTLGVLVDAVHEVLDVDAADLDAVPRLGTRIHPQYIRSMVRVRGQTTPELDLGAVLDPCELSSLIGTHMTVH